MICEDYIIEICKKCDYMKNYTIGCQLKSHELGENTTVYYVYENKLLHKKLYIDRKHDDEHNIEIVNVSYGSEIILRITEEWYIELPYDVNVYRPSPIYKVYRDNSKELLGVTVGFMDGNLSLRDVKIDIFNEYLAKMGINIPYHEWGEKQFLSYKLKKDERGDSLDDIAFELEDYVK